MLNLRKSLIELSQFLWLTLKKKNISQRIKPLSLQPSMPPKTELNICSPVYLMTTENYNKYTNNSYTMHVSNHSLIKQSSIKGLNSFQIIPTFLQIFNEIRFGTNDLLKKIYIHLIVYTY